jgi:hypothetical protein
MAMSWWLLAWYKQELVSFAEVHRFWKFRFQRFHLLWNQRRFQPWPLLRNEPISNFSPTFAHVVEPTLSPTKAPTNAPTHPTKNPTKDPSPSPTRDPSQSPTKEPSLTRTKDPSSFPRRAPTRNPTKAPTPAPTRLTTAATTTNLIADSAVLNQSSTYSVVASSLVSWAIDGNTYRDFWTCGVAHTAAPYDGVGYGTTDPWWSVDLGLSAYVKIVRIWNRSDAVRRGYTKELSKYLIQMTLSRPVALLLLVRKKFHGPNFARI